MSDFTPEDAPPPDPAAELARAAAESPGGPELARGAAPGRIVVVESIYHQLPGEQPVGTERRFARTLATDDQPAERRVTVTGTWALIPFGWLAPGAVSFLTVYNREGQDLAVVPSAAAAAETRKRVIHIAFAGDDTAAALIPALEIPPGEAARIPLHPAARPYARCPAGAARADVAVYPR